MPKYRCTIRHEYISFVDIEADDESEAYDYAEDYIADGGMGKDGYWNTREVDEPELICPYCNEPRFDSATVTAYGSATVSVVFSIPCCAKGQEDAEIPY